MTVVPESTLRRGNWLKWYPRERIAHTGLVGNVEVVQERVTRCDGTLIHKGGTVSPVSSVLEHTVPMLE